MRCKYLKVFKCWERIPAETKQLSPSQRLSSCCCSGSEAGLRNSVPFRGARAAPSTAQGGGISAPGGTTKPQKGNPEPELNQDATISIPTAVRVWEVMDALTLVVDTSNPSTHSLQPALCSGMGQVTRTRTPCGIQEHFPLKSWNI